MVVGRLLGMGKECATLAHLHAGLVLCHRPSSERSSSTGLVLSKDCLFNHWKCAFQSARGRVTSFGSPNWRVKGGPFRERMTTGTPLRAVLIAQAVRR